MIEENGRTRQETRSILKGNASIPFIIHSLCTQASPAQRGAEVLSREASRPTRGHPVEYAASVPCNASTGQAICAFS
jgi:hypothetical protein